MIVRIAQMRCTEMLISYLLRWAEVSNKVGKGNSAWRRVSEGKGYRTGGVSWSSWKCEKLILTGSTEYRVSSSLTDLKLWMTRSVSLPSHSGLRLLRFIPVQRVTFRPCTLLQLFKTGIIYVTHKQSALSQNMCSAEKCK